MSEYTDLITSQHRQPNFTAVVELLTAPALELQSVMATLVEALDVDVAVGDQLDILGEWIGISRQQRVPIANAYFSWGDAALGWGKANWKGPFQPSEGIVTLDDRTYRAVLKSKIASNYWSGTNEQSWEIGSSSAAELGVYCFMVDNFDMTVTVYIIGAVTAALEELARRGLFVPKPMGVRIASVIVGGSGGPRFALSVPTTPLVAGLDFGSFD